MALNGLQENLLRRATLGDLVTRSAARFRNRTALVAGQETIDFKTLNEKSCRAANAFLAMGIGKGDRVAFMTHNCLNYIYFRLGLSKIGAAPVPLNFMLKGEEIVYIIQDSEPKAFFVEDSLAESVMQLRPRLTSVEHFGWFDFGAGKPMPGDFVDLNDLLSEKYPDTEPEIIIDSGDMATLMYTTGTESFPKGVVTTHLNYYMSMLHLACDCDFRREDVLVIDIPLFHVAGTTVLLASITFGARAIIAYAPDPMNILRTTQDQKVTMWIYPPTLYHALPTIPGFERFDLSSLKKCISFGSVMAPGILQRWKAIKPDIQWRNYWGQTESSPVGTTSSPEDFEEKINSIGISDTGVTVKVFDENDGEVPLGHVGELVIRGPAIMGGYWKKEELTEKTLANGWLHTGDMGYMDQDGYFHFTDRKKDMIKTGGENVSSQEVESVIIGHPNVGQVAVIGQPDEYWSEAVSAFIVPKPGLEIIPEEIILFCKERMAGYKVPKRITVVSELPMSATGKVFKRKLREEYAEKSA
jgi:fatty-acyl-CoA synthase